MLLNGVTFKTEVRHVNFKKKSAVNGLKGNDAIYLARHPPVVSSYEGRAQFVKYNLQVEIFARASIQRNNTRFHKKP